jgi:hypothetical protein
MSIEQFVSRNGRRIAVEDISPPARKRKSSKKDYLHEDMDEIVAGLNATSIVWVRLLQLRRMRKEKHLALSNDWLSQHGVTRYAKMRALQTPEHRGLIRVTQAAGRSPRIVIISRRERRRPAKSGVAEPLLCAA